MKQIAFVRRKGHRDLKTSALSSENVISVDAHFFQFCFICRPVIGAD